MPETQDAKHHKALLALVRRQHITYNGAMYTVESTTAIHGTFQQRRHRISLKSDASAYTMLYIVADSSDSGGIRTAWMTFPMGLLLSSDMLNGFTWQDRRFERVQQGTVRYYPDGAQHASMYRFVEFNARDDRSPQALLGERMPGANWKMSACYSVDPTSIRICD